LYKIAPRFSTEITECCIALYVYLLILGYISDGEEAGYEPELGMVEDDELGVG
jgi:hypothetical protein